MATIIELNEENTCKFCDNSLAKYSCPRCNLIYCSLTCYQSEKHLECSENFYRKCVENELRSIDGNSEISQKIKEILARNHQNGLEEELGNEQLDSDDNDDDDDDFTQDLTKRLANVNLDDADNIWEKLTESEKQEFMAFVKSEDVTKFIEPWKPWWTNYRKIQSINETDYKKTCPTIEEILELNKLSQKSPSDCVKFNLMNVLGAYVFTTRYFNGEYYDFSHEAVTCLLTISLNLKTNQNFHNFDTVIKSIEQESINTDWILTDKENFEIMKSDLEEILKGPHKNDQKFYILSALSDIYRLMKKSLTKHKSINNEKSTTSTGKSNFQQIFPNDTFPDVKLVNKKIIRNCLRKIEYFLAFTKAFGIE